MEDLKASAETDLVRNKIAICLADLTHGRLIESVAFQLSLQPVFLKPDEVLHSPVLAETALLVADEAVVNQFGHQEVELLGLPVQPALVAAVREAQAEEAYQAASDHEQIYDGLLVLPQPPSAIVAQLSIILYAHRANVRRYLSAMDELTLNRLIFRSVNSGISVASTATSDLPLVYVNPAFEVISGYSLEEIQGKNCRFLQGEDRDQPGLVLVREAIREKRKTVAVLRNYKKDGTPFWNELYLSPIFDKHGHVTHFVGIQTDVTARVAFEEALRESEKLATAGRLAASIAHEINNPLESITNLLYLAQHSQADEVSGYLDQIDRELRRVSLLTSQSLRFYKQSSKPQAVRPTDLVTSVLDVYSVKLKNWAINVERRDTTADSVVCLESEIRQVLSNLIRNAMEAMRGQGGRLLVRVRKTRDWQREVDGIAITVADTGQGMTRETKEKLYQAFYTTKGEAGNGLGLWVSNEIVQRHHGKLTLRSRQSEGHAGTVFALFLPYQAIDPEAPGARDSK